MDWETTPPPRGEEIEFETDRGEIRRGRINVYGQMVIDAETQTPPAQANDQFIVDGPKPTAVGEIRRWRRLG